MSWKKIVYQNWIMELGYDPGRESNKRLPVNFNNEDYQNEDISKMVWKVLEKLRETEKEFIIHFYFMGESFSDISEKTGRAVYRLAALQKQAIKKLKKGLASFVKDRYNINPDPDYNCPVCSSSDLKVINYLIKKRDKSRTWRPVMQALKEKYNIKISTPQILIGHEKYHNINQ